ncbi:hypothetical protein [Mycobacterium parmense]|uniref:Uncharacterized protein n=1 Tax=Mycobacterium parmense TaxID=185642 RepID=A0A7I7Z384_9MYCO|nr:hypothetical protein [Mycobacterium parmense]MCV7348565.1 hypothetical protein [Mycobacterium parmense]ORW51468.1 hypothetical protein AWC20_22980 [Mycobacterium parmense]BBZ47684.1 hypothetical protein MPRM_49650 [Mycobacterium parmense]
MGLFGYLAILAGVAELAFAAAAFVFVNRLLEREPTSTSEEVGSSGKVFRKLRKGEPMSEDELEFAAQAVFDRGSLMAFSIPAAIFSLGCIFLFGGLEVHGPHSLRPYIGLFPMFGSLNMTIRLLRIAALKKRLRFVGDLGWEGLGGPR